MSPSIASIVTPFMWPAVLSMSPSFPRSHRPRGLPDALPGASRRNPPRYFTRAGRHSCSCLRSSSCELNFLPHCWHLNSSMDVLPSASLLRRRSRTVVLQRELHRHAVPLLHVLERRGRKVKQHPALRRLDEDPTLVGSYAGDFTRHRMAASHAEGVRGAVGG